ncbi:MAG: hypothetical protein D6732_02595 [Methanobacteriota archaeon]|nr:MAG: hypothetical protein D6732_02595 [Euryarchaeota archaeon]
MEDELFYRNLKVNILEMMKPSAARRNRPKLTDVDFLAKLKPLYMLSNRKPTPEEAMNCLDELIAKGLVREGKMDAVKIWSITDKGVEVLKELSHGEEVDL